MERNFIDCCSSILKIWGSKIISIVFYCDENHGPIFMTDLSIFIALAHAKIFPINYKDYCTRQTNSVLPAFPKSNNYC